MRSSCIQERIYLVREEKPFGVIAAEILVAENESRPEEKRINTVLVPEHLLEYGAVAVLENAGIQVKVKRG